MQILQAHQAPVSRSCLKPGIRATQYHWSETTCSEPTKNCESSIKSSIVNSLSTRIDSKFFFDSVHSKAKQRCPPLMIYHKQFWLKSKSKQQKMWNLVLASCLFIGIWLSDPRNGIQGLHTLYPAVLPQTPSYLLSLKVLSSEMDPAEIRLIR